MSLGVARHCCVLGILDLIAILGSVNEWFSILTIWLGIGVAGLSDGFAQPNNANDNKQILSFDKLFMFYSHFLSSFGIFQVVFGKKYSIEKIVPIGNANNKNANTISESLREISSLFFALIANEVCNMIKGRKNNKQAINN
jgi:hypothetical protein